MVNVSRSNWEDFRKWFSAVRKHSLLFPPSLSFCPESEENEKSTYGNDSLLSIIRKTVRHDLFLFDKWTLEKEDGTMCNGKPAVSAAFLVMGNN